MGPWVDFAKTVLVVVFLLLEGDFRPVCFLARAIFDISKRQLKLIDFQKNEWVYKSNFTSQSVGCRL